MAQVNTRVDDVILAKMRAIDLKKHGVSDRNPKSDATIIRKLAIAKLREIEQIEELRKL